jgi:hypothetical protein
MVDDCVQTSVSTLRHSISGADRVILKYNGTQPSSLTGYTEYTHSQMSTIVEGIEWDENSFS